MMGSDLGHEVGAFDTPIPSPRSTSETASLTRDSAGQNVVVGATVALALFAALLVKWTTTQSVPAPSAQPPVSATVPPSPPTAGDNLVSAPAPAPTEPFAVDDRGFVNSSARCEGPQTAVAIGRTQGSLVVICAQNGEYGYLGVRLSDDALLRTAARTTPTHEFVAENANVTYSVSSAELRVTVGRTVIKQEPMIEFREPR
jgi:hypothetical protein